jgi:hypothetical protein
VVQVIKKLQLFNEVSQVLAAEYSGRRLTVVQRAARVAPVHVAYNRVLTRPSQN